MGLPVATALAGHRPRRGGRDHRQPHPRGPGLRAVHRVHDRSRRRHRLRAAHRHALSGAAARRPRHPRVDRHRDGHGGPFGGVRRGDRRRVAVRHALHGHRVRRRARGDGLAHRALHGPRLDHAAARDAGVRRPQHRAHEVARADRRRLRGARARRRGAGDCAARHGRGPVRSAHHRAGLLRPTPPAKVGHRPPKLRRETTAYRWSRVIQHRPWPFAIEPPLLWSWRSRSSASASGSPTRATSWRTPPRSRPTTWSWRASGRAPRARSTWWPPWTAPSRSALGRQSTRPSRPTRPSSRAWTSAQRPGRPDGRALDRDARLRTARRGDV